MKTRKQYMNKDVTHDEYYGQFGKHLIPIVCAGIGKGRIKKSTDPHFNDIPLRMWDAMHPTIFQAVGRMIAEANGTGGVSLSDTVCAAKAAARMIRDGE